MVKDLASAAIVITLVAVAGAQYLGSKTPPPAQLPSQAPVAASAEPATPQLRTVSQGRTITLQSDGRGHFVAELESNGIRFPALVDTGASVIALPAGLANKLGYFPGPEAFTASVTTANGEVKVASVTLREVRLAGIEIRNVEAVIMPDESLKGVLLGMSFLSKLKSFKIADNTLTMVN